MIRSIRFIAGIAALVAMLLSSVEGAWAMMCSAAMEMDVPEARVEPVAAGMPENDMPGMDMAGVDMPGMDMPGMDMPDNDMPGMDMPGMEDMAEGAHADCMRHRSHGSADGQGPQPEHCPFMPVAASSCVLGVSLPSDALSETPGAFADPVLLPSSDDLPKILLGRPLFHPPKP